MKLIVGLGNPGKDYDRTRHNAGFMVVDRLVQRHGMGATVKSRFNAGIVEAKLPGAQGAEACLLVKPTTYMNRSGQTVAEAVRFYKLDPAMDLMVISDDVALPSGTIRLRPAGGAGGHNGLSDITRLLGTDAYPRCRVGVDATPEYMDQADYVLGRFTDAQWALVGPAVDKAADAVETFVKSGMDAAMNKFNAPEGPAKPKRGGPAST